ncbi:MAG: nucleotidyltransferase domain-containing protein [Actinomycetota bacterium]|nr:nucleotidyltransferase domain-containing protein [Actinomycetota bacterium]
MRDLEAFRAQANSVLAALASWAPTREDIESIILVGSYARGAERVDSDIDVVLLVSDVTPLLAEDAWLDALVPGAAEIRREAWGPVTERRMLLPSGLIVEFGITTKPWAAVPLDAGTARVLGDGSRVIYDPRDVAATAIAAISVVGRSTRAAAEADVKPGRLQGVTGLGCVCQHECSRAAIDDRAPGSPLAAAGWGCADGLAHTHQMDTPSIERVVAAVTASWSAATCHATSEYVAAGRSGDRSRGQCGTTALVVQDLLGGELLVAQVQVNGSTDGVHYWNRLPGGQEIDLTRTQFSPAETLGDAKRVDRTPGMPPRRGADTYLLLRRRVSELLGTGRPDRP